MLQLKEYQVGLSDEFQASENNIFSLKRKRKNYQVNISTYTYQDCPAFLSNPRKDSKQIPPSCPMKYSSHYILIVALAQKICPKIIATL